MTQSVSHVLKFLAFFTVKCSSLGMQLVAMSSSIPQLIKALVTFACRLFWCGGTEGSVKW